MSDDYLWDRSGSPDREVKTLEDLLAPLGHDAPLDELRLRKRSKLPWIAGALVIAAAAALAIVLVRPRDTDSCAGYRYERDGDAGTLCVGATLDTGGARKTVLALGDIGHAELAANTRLTLDRLQPDAQHLTLDRGWMHAKVNAPPRLFQVATPSADVVDLGCEYTLEIDADGAGRLAVSYGQVELATKSGAIVVAPAGTHATILPGRVPGLPVADGAPREVEAAVAAIDHGDAGAVAALLAAATPRDAITLVNLAALDDAHRRVVLERLATLSPPPAGTTVDSAMDPKQLQPWMDDVRLDQRFRVEH